MKKIILFLSLLITIILHSQVGQYKASVNGYGHHSDHADSGELKISLNFNIGSQLNLLQTGYGTDPFNMINNIYFEANKKVISISFYAKREWRTCGLCGRESSTRLRTIPINYPYSCIVYSSDMRGYNTFDNAMWYDNINIKIEPLLTIIPSDNDMLPIEDNITISSHTGFASAEYNWQYSTDLNPNTWIDLPQFQGMSSISLNAQDVFNGNAYNYLNQRVYFKQKSCDYSSAIVNYTVRKSAPHLTSTIPSNVSCYDSNNGSIRLQFDRPLVAGEDLSIVVKRDNANNLSAPSWGEHAYANYNNIILNPDNSYTLSNLDVGNYKIDLVGFYNGNSTYTDGANHTAIVTINKPSPVVFTSSKVDVWCNGGNDGQITINGSGGVGNYQYQLTMPDGTVLDWTAFNNGNQAVLSNLWPGVYRFKVRDGNGCVARQQTLVSGNIQLGPEIIQNQTINQPTAPVSVAYQSVSDPLAYGFTDGYIVAVVEGGTPLAGNNYNYVWKDQSGNVLPNTQVVSTSPWTVKATGLGDGKYYLTVTDANHNAATNKAGCTIANSEITLVQPPPLVASLELSKPISCHVNNEYGNNADFHPSDGQRDESQDGQIKATVTGGKPYTGTANGGKPYQYIWKKQLANGTWQTLTNQTNPTAIELAHGNYAFNVLDANGITIGTYVNNTLVTANDLTYFLQQPEQLKLSFASAPVTCALGNNGQLTANITGGTPPYTYQWSTGETTSSISDLTVGNYFVIVKDARGCSVQGSEIIPSPSGVVFTETLKKNPTCYGGNDGELKIDISGGVPPYSYAWNTGQTTNYIDGLKAGKYIFTVIDGNGCVNVQYYTLTDPPKHIIDLGPDRVLCNQQTVTLNGTISDPNSTYLWTFDGSYLSDKPSISVAFPGTYRIKTTSSLGCIAEDEIKISQSATEIDSRFVITSQAYLNEEVVLVNVSNPEGETTEWLIPTANVEVISKTKDYVNLRFTQTGSYAITLRSTQGACYADFTSRILVEEKIGQPKIGATDNPFIKEFTVAPNPNNGQFMVVVSLSKESPISLRLVDMAGGYVSNEIQKSGQSVYEINYNLSLAPATYMLILQTPEGTVTKKLIVN